jgi:hypothetical protein
LGWGLVARLEKSGRVRFFVSRAQGGGGERDSGEIFSIFRGGFDRHLSRTSPKRTYRQVLLLADRLEITHVFIWRNACLEN